MQGDSTVVAGVVYPGVEKFLVDFVASLRTQTCSDFDLLMVNDGADQSVKSAFPQQTIWIDLDKRMTIAEIRGLLINRAKSSYSRLVFVDVDDFFTEDRVERSIAGLEGYDFVFNELTLVDSDGRVLHPNYLSSLGVEGELEGFSALLDRNVIGLSNSAINLQGLPNLCIPSDLIAVDWWIYTVLLINGRRGKFLRDTVTFYRQHGANTIGMKPMLTPEKLQLGLLVKKIQYRNMVPYCAAKGDDALAERFLEKLREAEAVEAMTTESSSCEQYVEKVNRNFSSINNGWWSEIISIGRFNHYE